MTGSQTGLVHTFIAAAISLERNKGIYLGVVPEPEMVGFGSGYPKINPNPKPDLESLLSCGGQSAGVLITI